MQHKLRAISVAAIGRCLITMRVTNAARKLFCLKRAPAEMLLLLEECAILSKLDMRVMLGLLTRIRNLYSTGSSPNHFKSSVPYAMDGVMMIGTALMHNGFLSVEGVGL
jgi:hypothetical protein